MLSEVIWVLFAKLNVPDVYFWWKRMNQDRAEKSCNIQPFRNWQYQLSSSKYPSDSIDNAKQKIQDKEGILINSLWSSPTSSWRTAEPSLITTSRRNPLYTWCFVFVTVSKLLGLLEWVDKSWYCVTFDFLTWVCKCYHFILFIILFCLLNWKVLH
jgi:hypothetical protein